VGAVLGASFVLPGATFQPPLTEAAARPNSCGSGWASTTRPPNSIRVLRRRTGRVTRVPFRHYVVTVMGKEWPSYLPQPVIEAGAVAVKQYGWYHTISRAHRSGRGQCFDVRDGVSDQLYKPGKARVRPDHRAAASKTWNVRLLKNGRLFMTGYRRGSGVRCGRDHTGYKLYARSATNCARRGYSYLQILRRYYGPSLDIVNGGGSGSRRVTSGQIEARSSAPQRERSSRPAATQSAADRTAPARARRSRTNPTTPTALTPVEQLFASYAASSGPLELVARRGSGVGLIDIYLDGTRVGQVAA
jgi:hypothetical protein